MADHRYLSKNLVSTPECELFVLPGLDADDNAFAISGLTITRLELLDWLMIEKSQFSDDLMGDIIRKTPLFCMFASNDIHVSDEVANYRFKSRAIQVQRLIRSLRLLHRGRIYDPLDFIIYTRRGASNIRNPSRYGRKAYELSSTYLLKGEELGVLEGIYNSLTVFDVHRTNSAISIAENLFNRSYDLALKEDTDQVLLLLGAIDALVGTNVSRLVMVPWPDGAVSDFLQKYRVVRNLVAHGKSIAETGASDYLREVTRCLLRESIAYVLEEPSCDKAVGRSLVNRMRSCLPDDIGAQRLANVATKYSAPSTQF